MHILNASNASKERQFYHLQGEFDEWMRNMATDMDQMSYVEFCKDLGAKRQNCFQVCMKKRCNKLAFLLGKQQHAVAESRSQKDENAAGTRKKNRMFMNSKGQKTKLQVNARVRSDERQSVAESRSEKDKDVAGTRKKKQRIMNSTGQKTKSQVNGSMKNDESQSGHESRSKEDDNVSGTRKKK